MTKKEILRKSTSGIGCAYYDGIEYDGETGNIEDAMDEYAKQEAIGFAEWHYKTAYKYINVEGFEKSHPDYIKNHKLKSTEELYELYLKSKPQ